MAELKVLRSGDIVFEEDGRKVDPDRILQFLSESVILEEQFTLRDYFKMLEEYKHLWLLDTFTADYVKEYRECPKKGCYGKRDIHRLALSRVVEISEYAGVQEFEMHFDFSGIGTPPKDDPNYPPSLDEVGYAIEFCHLNELLDVPLTLDKVIFTIGNDFDNTVKYPTTFNLFELFKHVMWELSFLGTPEDRDSSRVSLHSAMEEVEEAIATGDTSKFVSIDELFDDAKKLLN